MKIKFVIDNNKIIHGPGIDINYIPGENQEIKIVDVDENNPFDWCKIDGKLGFHAKSLYKWDHAKGHPVLKTKTEKDKEKKDKEKLKLKEKLIELKIKAIAGNELGIDMTIEEDEIINLKSEYDKL